MLPSTSALNRFVREHWDQLAAAAWYGYIRFGRGALLVSPTVIADAGRGPSARWRPAYVVSASVEPVRVLVESYDPERAIVVLSLPDGAGGPRRFGDGEIETRIVALGQSLDAGIFEYLPTPRRAHRRLAS